MIKFRLFQKFNAESQLFVYVDPFNVAAVEEGNSTLYIDNIERSVQTAVIDTVGTSYLVWDEDRTAGEKISAGTIVD